MESEGRNATRDDFPREGVKFSWILSTFIPEECGGRKQLEGLTTAQVCRLCVQQHTANAQQSHCEKLKAQEEGKKHVGIPTVFASHVFCCPFLDAVDALEMHLSHELDQVVVWWDLFSMNQHHMSNQTCSFQWLSATFKMAIAEIGRLVMVIAKTPWNQPLPHTRSWCVCEACCALTSDPCVSFEIALSPATNRQQFLKMVKEHNNSTRMIQHMLSPVQSEQSTATVKQDQDNILAVMREDVGFFALDTLLRWTRFCVIGVVDWLDFWLPHQ